MSTARNLAIPIPHEKIAAFCQRWRIQKLSFFGSVVRDDFGPNSDIDVLVSFDPRARWSLTDLVEMQEELTALFGRPVDLVEQEALRNPFRRQSILNTKKVVYAA